MNNSKIFYPFLLTVFLAVGVLVGRKMNPEIIGITNTSNYNKIRDVIDILDARYVDTVDANKLFESTIQELLHKLDPHSTYISKEDLKAAQERVDGVFGGIGVRFFLLRDTVSITNVIANAPAMKAGLKAGDKLLTADGELISGAKMANDEIMKLLKGKPNSDVVVEVLRNGKIETKTITRGMIPYTSVATYYMLEKEVGYVKIDEFSRTTADEFRKATKHLRTQGMNKLVLDLRGNGGGVLESAILIAEEFLPKGKLIVTTKGKNFPKEEIYSKRNGSLMDVSLTIILNENSASASEVVAGALQDQDRATIVGRRSFGKGLVQQDIRLRDGSDLRLVVARYYTPTGRCIQKPYSGNYEDYVNEFHSRYEDGEVYHKDSVKVADSLQYKTPKGKVVYGGGGIYPDVFVPLDSTLNTWYIAELYYKGTFQAFSFDFVKGKRNHWKNMHEFKKSFIATDEVYKQFMQYIDANYDIVSNSSQNPKRIKEILKAEIARQLWEETGYFYMHYHLDKEVMKSVQILSEH